MEYPWRHKDLISWSIVGMNHYFIHGKKLLFVAMIKGEKCIKEEGPDSQYLWKRLCYKAIDADNKSFNRTEAG